MKAKSLKKRENSANIRKAFVFVFILNTFNDPADAQHDNARRRSTKE